LFHYLSYRYESLTNNPTVKGAVAMYCDCHDEGEVDVRPIRRGQGRPDGRCLRCGSHDVILEELPPRPPTLRVEQ
jgi:hypothetical protein